MNVILATFECTLPFFSRFRNSEDRRNFISAGAAAGIASAFGAPVGGLLFAMEEVSSFWKNKLSWQVFFCCMVATFTTDLLNSAFHGFKYKGDFGLFKPKFIPKDLIAVNVIAVIPAILLGIVGGVLGSAFTQLNLLISRTRKKLMVRIKGKVAKNLVRMLETVGVLVIISSVHIFVPALIGEFSLVELGLLTVPPGQAAPRYPAPTLPGTRIAKIKMSASPQTRVSQTPRSTSSSTLASWRNTTSRPSGKTEHLEKY